MSLQGMLYRKHVVGWDIETVASEEPVSVRLVNIDIGRLVRWWRICVRVGRIHFDTEISFMCT